jgi:hypothetical protein
LKRYLPIGLIIFLEMLSLNVMAQDSVKSSKQIINFSQNRSGLNKVDIQTDSIEISDKGNFPKSAKEVLDGLQINGYYRFITNIRKMKETYSHLENNKTNIFVGDDAQIPQLLLNIAGNTSNKTSFGTDLFIWSPMTGQGQTENVKGLNLGISLYGNFSTSVGNFNVRTGGINWLSLSPFTFQANKGYNRYSLFERNPWDPNTSKIESRYSEFYNSGAINQDQRWGNQAFQGLIVDGASLPKNFSFTALYGKTQFDGGLNPLPNTSFGGRLKKDYPKNNNFISFNTLNNKSFIDSLSEKTAGFNVHTLEMVKHFQKLKFYAEIGVGRRTSNVLNEKFGEAISLKFTGNIKRKFPTELHLYRISPRILNNSSIFMNSSIQQTTQLSAANQPVLIPVSSAVLPIGQLANNRQGLDINTQIDFGRFKNSIGYGNSMELEELSSKITYGHPFNNIAMAHFWRWNFPSNVGPYQNLNKIYRSVFETLNLTEVDSTGIRPIKKKFFNTIELNSKYKTTLAHKELFIFYLGNFNSVQNFIAPIVNFNEKSLLRTYDHQLEMYWKISPSIVWNNYASFERIIANYQTQTDLSSRRPKNQTGYSFATGADFQMSKSVGLYVRQRWMQYADASFALDKYKGWETTIELKAFF